MGVEKLVMMTVTDPERAHMAIDAATDFCIEYGRQQVAAGAHMLFPADPSASGDLISPETYQEFVLPYHQKFAKAVSAPKILHMCGHTEKCTSRRVTWTASPSTPLPHGSSGRSLATR